MEAFEVVKKCLGKKVKCKVVDDYLIIKANPTMGDFVKLRYKLLDKGLLHRHSPFECGKGKIRCRLVGQEGSGSAYSPTESKPKRKLKLSGKKKRSAS